MIKFVATLITVPMALAAGFVGGIVFSLGIGIVDESTLIVVGGVVSGWLAAQTVDIIWS